MIDAKITNIEGNSIAFEYKGLKVKANYTGYVHNCINVNKGKVNFDVWHSNINATDLIEKLTVKENFNFVRKLSRFHFRTQEKYVRALLKSDNLNDMENHFEISMKAMKTRMKNNEKLEGIFRDKFKSWTQPQNLWKKRHVYFDDNVIILKIWQNEIIDLKTNIHYYITDSNVLKYFEGKKWKGKIAMPYQFKDFVNELKETKLLPKDKEEHLDRVLIIDAV
jgi:hypothetical protein